MRNILFAAPVFMLLLGCSQPIASNSMNSPQQPPAPTAGTLPVSADQTIKTVDPARLFTKTDAEKILGQPAGLTDSISSANPDISSFKCTYTAFTKDQKTGKTGAVYFMYEEYKEDSAAHKEYISIKTANEKNGIKVLPDLGDEAYFHTDGENFYFVLVRKGARMIRIKVNKVTSATSLNEFNLVSRNITSGL